MPTILSLAGKSSGETQGDVGAALRALEAAAAKGFADVSTLQRDPCLRPLAAEPRFQTLVRTLGGGAQR